MSIVRSTGAVPATVAIIEGRVHVGRQKIIGLTQKKPQRYCCVFSKLNYGVTLKEIL